MPLPSEKTESPMLSNTDDGNDPKYASLPTDVAVLHSIINSLQAELKATNSVNTHLAASVARLQAEQATTPATTPLPCPHPDIPYTIASGRGAASAEIFRHHGQEGEAPCGVVLCKSSYEP